MLSVAACRKLLGTAGTELSDAQVEQVRDSMALLVGVALDKVQHLPDYLREEVGERAAIMEFEGGMTRSAADRAAIVQVTEGARRTDAG